MEKLVDNFVFNAGNPAIEHTVLAIGRVGAGKSTILSALVGSSEFYASDSAESVT